MFKAVASVMSTSMLGQEQPSSSQGRSRCPWSDHLPWVRRQREVAEAAQAKAQRRLNKEHLRNERQKRREELELRVHQLLDQVWVHRRALRHHSNAVDILCRALGQYIRTRHDLHSPEQLREHDEKLCQELETLFTRNRQRREDGVEDQVDSRARTARS